MKFIGRVEETTHLNNLYKTKQAQLITVYGRRRIGKSRLLEEFITDKPHLRFDGLDGIKTAGQIEQFAFDMARQIQDPLLQNIQFKTWPAVFDYLNSYFERNKTKKIVILLDEFQWLAANQSKLVSLIKSYWDRFWQKHNIMLILCGSISSYMVNKVIKSKALYGRINWELCLQPLLPKEIYQFLGTKRNQQEAILYSMILGGIPKYLQEINTNQSFEQNINRLFFTNNALFVNEYEKVFYSQFKEHKLYEAIVKFLSNQSASLAQISQHLKLTSSGGVKKYLENLEQAAFIQHFIPYNKNTRSKLIKYKLTDEYLRFYFKFIQPNLRLIQSNRSANLFKRLVTPTWKPWLGMSFENYCFKHADYIAKLMGFEDQTLQWGPYFQRGEKNFQIDLIFLRQDKVITLCEIKFTDQLISTKIVSEVQRKCELITIPRGYVLERALISRYGMEPALAALDYFHHSMTVDDFFSV